MAGFSSSSRSQQKTFTPPTPQWQREKARQLRVDFVNDLRYGQTKYYSNTSGPTRTFSVEADGNCFFRALSVVITGNEISHMRIREEITRHVQNHSDIYRTFLQSRGGMDTYVRSMRRAREWATDTEIFAAATFLNTIIEVCSVLRTRNGTEYQWQTFSPLKERGDPHSRIYICHKYEHFEPIIDVSDGSERRSMASVVPMDRRQSVEKKLASF